MGMDISGKGPVPPKKYEDCKADEDLREYFKWQDETPGVYFRASIWNWGPLIQFIEAAIAAHNLGFDTKLWHYNDGAGLDNQADCDRLADAMDDLPKRVDPKQWNKPGAVATDFSRLMGMTVPVSLDTERVQRFIVFLRHCGGFEIY